VENFFTVGNFFVFHRRKSQNTSFSVENPENSLKFSPNGLVDFPFFSGKPFPRKKLPQPIDNRQKA